MSKNDTVTGEIVENAESVTKSPFTLPKSKKAYALYGAGALLVVASVAAAFVTRTQISDETTDDSVASDNETTVN